MDSSLVLKCLLVLVVVVGVAELTGSTDKRTTEEKAIAEIQKLGGIVRRDEQDPIRPVVSVDLSRTLVTDAGLKNVAAFTQLKKLDLHGTRITDAGLPHLQGLTRLQWLFLGQTEVTAAGMAHLQGLNQLEWLCLSMTEVNDAGLEHLKGLTQLKMLSLGRTKVTDAGLKHLKVADATSNVVPLRNRHNRYRAGTSRRAYPTSRTEPQRHPSQRCGIGAAQGPHATHLLDLEGTQVTGAGMKGLQDAFPNCLLSPVLSVAAETNVEQAKATLEIAMP